MAKLSDMSQQAQLAVVFGVLALLSVGLYFFVYKSMADSNQETRLKVEAKQAENDKLRPYEANLPELNRTTEAFRMQLENLQRIVPDEKDVDKFLHVMQEQARKSNVRVRSYVAKDTLQREFYTEVPFDIQLDGHYSAVLSFFEDVGKQERIINISDLKVYGIKGAEKAPSKAYTYAPNETVVALCRASTFFSHDPNRAAGGKKQVVK